MKVLEYIQSESDRQSATLRETIGMVHAWEYVRDFGDRRRPNVFTVVHIATLINGIEGYRVMPAVFNQGRPALEASLIPNAMRHWADWSEADGFDPNQIDSIIKEFLEIHPFADGNGRVASLLYNHFRGTILDPVPLPYYYGGNAYYIDPADGVTKLRKITNG